MLTPKEVLAKAADIMSERGMSKGSYEDLETHQVCAYGAMTLAITDGRESNAGCLEGDRLLEPAARLLAYQINPEQRGFTGAFTTITSYNDAAKTSAEDMILNFKRAAGL